MKFPLINHLLSLYSSSILRVLKYAQKDKQNHFEVLKKIQKKPESTQRQLAEGLDFSYMSYEI